MDAPPPPYSEHNPNQTGTFERTHFKRKPVSNSDTKTGNHASHGYVDFYDGAGPSKVRSDIDDSVSGRDKDSYVGDKVAPDEFQFDLDDYYATETPAEQARAEKPHVEIEDTRRARRPGLSVETLNISSRAYSSPAQLQHDIASSPALSYRSATGSAITLPLTPDSSKSNITPATKTFQDLRHLAGGVIQRPYESTKHITIVRHSHGLVFYQGNRTQVAITIFADDQLPEGRTLWLQQKGFTGTTGARINVTPKPDAKVEAHQLNQNDERAWQRDIKKFREKGPTKIREKHLPRETHIIGIPANPGDGYFILVLCLGDKKKVLCESPRFRVLSASRDPSSVKGAPMLALPLEFGIKAGAIALNLYAKNSVGRATTLVTVATNSASRFKPKSFVASQVTSKVTGLAGNAISSVVADGNKQYHDTRSQALASFGNVNDVEAVLNEGPKAPYPFTFVGRGGTEIGNVIEELEMPYFGLVEVKSHMMDQLHGYYFGWARAYNKKSTEECDWSQAIISATTLDITQLERIKIGQALTKTIGLRLMTDFEDCNWEQGVKFEVMVSGFIRADEPALEKAAKEGCESAIDSTQILEFNDVSIAEQFLNHPAWSAAVTTRPKLEERKSSGLQKLGETYANTRATAQKKIDQIGLHRLGVRLEGGNDRSKTQALSGYYVAR